MNTLKKTPIKYNTPFVFHFRKWNYALNQVEPKGGLTVVFNPQNRHFGIAECSKKDMYCRKLGRIIALGRSKWARYCLEDGEVYVENIRKWAYQLASQRGYTCYACGIRYSPEDLENKND